ncbi:MAG: phosphoribosylformylglycinamidine synthase subunit PurL [Candidatus Neomarinimicrobiota bacterium]
MAFTAEIIDFTGLTDVQVQKQLAELNIPLSVPEARKIQVEMLGRPPSVAELVLFSIEGSEHCSYKSSRMHLKQFITEGPQVILGAKEDAGIVAVATDKKGRRWCVVMSHESHNHPSQIVPYEGAATGIGGNVRDVCCMGAEVIALSDSLRFGEISAHKTKWIHEEVVKGIGGYGNPLGIPSIGGDLYYDSGYNDNCLVTIVTLGILREDRIFHSYAPANADGYDLILIGKPTDNSGFGGASFASLELEEEKKEQNKGAVQEPNAFLERHILKSTNALFKILIEKELVGKVGFKDLGAGGVACASVELADAAGYGAEIWLDRVHRSQNGLHSSVYLCSETQERFMWVAEPDLTPLILDHYNNVFDLPAVSSGARASVIGKIRKHGLYIVHSGQEEIVNAPAQQITQGFLYDRPVKNPRRKFKEPQLPVIKDFNSILLKLLAHENISSREVVFETYDKQVQGRVIVETGRADAGVLAPFNSTDYPEEIRSLGIALSTDHNPRYAKIDPYWAAVNAVVESVRNVTAVGASPLALSDCLCFGNPEKPEQMWEFTEAVRGVAETCKTLKLKDHPDSSLPIIAGNVSFYNESGSGAIPASPIISCLGKMEDVSKALDLSFKANDSILFLVGERKDECGGSVFYSLFNELGANLPRPDLGEVQAQSQAITTAAEQGLILSAHDISEGGAAVSLAEMTFEHSLGCEVTIPGELMNEKKLFGETGGFVLEVTEDNSGALKILFRKTGVSFSEIGKTTLHQSIFINDIVNLPIRKAREAWENGLREKLI